VADNQPANKNRMNQELTNFAARLLPLLRDTARQAQENEFNALALELFALQLKHNPAYRKICAGRKLMPGAVEHWTEIPVVPTAVFKELELSSIPPAERTAVFHSSSTTEQKPSRHYHCPESLAVYEASLWSWFETQCLRSADSLSACSQTATTRGQAVRAPFIILTPPPEQAPNSSLVHMFETVRHELGAPESAFVGQISADGGWTLNFNAVIDALSSNSVRSRSSRDNEAQIKSETNEVRASSPAFVQLRPGRRRLLQSQPVAGPVVMLGTAFSFVHLLDDLVEKNLTFQLSLGSRVMETGGYKGRSRTMPKAELHALITDRLGISSENIICEYGMSELSSQAYALGAPACRAAASERRLTSRRRVPSLPTQQHAGEISLRQATARQAPALPGCVESYFRFPPWARVQIISPETGGEVAEGETGLIRVFDLANVFSVLAVQTEDLGLRRGDGFELIGRAALAEARGCSLMTV
jgi:hypothetical protein